MSSRTDQDSLVKSILSPERWQHTQNVVNLAERLSSQYDLPETKLATAALYHDLGKGLSLEEQQDRAESYRNPMDPVERKIPALWHGPAGAHYCREEISKSFPDEVLFAITEHSTGHPEPSPILQGLLVADFTEPGRTFARSGELREQIGHTSLRVLARETLKYKLKHTVDQNNLVHPRTVEAYNKICD